MVRGGVRDFGIEELARTSQDFFDRVPPIGVMSEVEPCSRWPPGAIFGHVKQDRRGLLSQYLKSIQENRPGTERGN
jgi:hypothetical protein